MAKTNSGLVIFAQQALAGKSGYVWGTFGQILTEALLESKRKQYPDQNGGSNYTFIKNNWMGKIVYDCVGLIKGYMWWLEDKNRLDDYSNAIKSFPDVNTNMLLSAAKEKGAIGTIDKALPGLGVYKKGHVGVYIGNNTVIEAASTKKGVIKTPLTGSGATQWTHWLKVPGMEYIKPVAPPQSTPAQPSAQKKYKKGDRVIVKNATLHGNSAGANPGKTVSGTYLITLDNGSKLPYNIGAKAGEHLGWIPESAITGFASGTAAPAAPKNPYAEPTSNLKKGSKGNGVRWIQWELNQTGAKLSVDGDFGPLTDKAVRVFQTAQKIAVDGIVGPATRTKLKAV